jgi:hypothetical protein
MQRTRRLANRNPMGRACSPFALSSLPSDGQKFHKIRTCLKRNLTLRGHFWTRNGMVTAKLGSRFATAGLSQDLMIENEATKGNSMFNHADP